MLYFPTMDVCTVYIAFNCVLWFEVSPGHFYICYCVQQTLFHIAISIKYCPRGHFNIGHYYGLQVYTVHSVTHAIRLKK
jgi:hypothetical protein